MHIAHIARNPESAAWRGFNAGRAENMFIRHVIRHVEAIKRIARNPGRVEVPRLGAAGT